MAEVSGVLDAIAAGIFHIKHVQTFGIKTVFESSLLVDVFVTLLLQQLVAAVLSNGLPSSLPPSSAVAPTPMSHSEEDNTCAPDVSTEERSVPVITIPTPTHNPTANSTVLSQTPADDEPQTTQPLNRSHSLGSQGLARPSQERLTPQIPRQQVLVLSPSVNIIPTERQPTGQKSFDDMGRHIAQSREY